jgi:hypothetical protein
VIGSTTVPEGVSRPSSDGHVEPTAAPPAS